MENFFHVWRFSPTITCHQRQKVGDSCSICTRRTLWTYARLRCAELTESPAHAIPCYVQVMHQRKGNDVDCTRHIHRGPGTRTGGDFSSEAIIASREYHVHASAAASGNARSSRWSSDKHHRTEAQWQPAAGEQFIELAVNKGISTQRKAIRISTTNTYSSASSDVPR